MNKLLISLLTILFLLNLMSPLNPISAAGSAKFSLTPSSASKSVGTTISIDIRVDTAGDKINSALASLTFPSDLLEADITTIGSFASFFSQRDVDNTKGTLVVNGGVKEGTSGDNLLLASINFKVKSTGVAKVNFSNQSVIYKGSSNVLGTSNGATLTLTAGSSSSSSSSARTSSSSGSTSITQPPVATSSSSSDLPKSGAFGFMVIMVLISLAAISTGAVITKINRA